MPMYYVYKKDWDCYIENRGVLVKSTSPNRAKWIAMASMFWPIGNDKKNIIVEEVDIVDEGVICAIDDLKNTTEYN